MYGVSVVDGYSRGSRRTQSASQEGLRSRRNVFTFLRFPTRVLLSRRAAHLRLTSSNALIQNPSTEYTVRRSRYPRLSASPGHTAGMIRSVVPESEIVHRIVARADD